MSSQTVISVAKSKYEYTDKIGVRRKALFPTSDSTDSDLGHMSPLHSDSNDSEVFQLYKSSISDYVLLGEESHAQLLSPLMLSPQQTNIPATPLVVSPTQKTPHDTSTVKINSKQQKRKLQEISLNTNEMDKSKVRTALFPEIVVSAKSFYPKNFQKFERISKENSPKLAKAKIANLCTNRRNKNKNRFGQINAGVRHKIKKPKIKKLVKAQLVKAALNIIDTSPLNDYLNEIATFSTKQIQKLPPPPIKVVNEDEYVREENEIEIKPKKFFKSSRSNAVVTISENIQIKVQEGGKMNLVDINAKKRKLEEPKLDAKDLLLSPTSQICDMALGLALNSPKRAKLNINALLDHSTLNEPVSSRVMEQTKLFPVFNKVILQTSASTKRPAAAPKKSGKKLCALPKDQMLLDAGQKRFGATQCSECHVVYCMGDPGDELMHLNYHNANNILKYNGWKHERIVRDDDGGKVVKVVPNDSKSWWKKINSLLEFINRDLGYYDCTYTIDHSQVYIYVSNKCIVGCLVAETRQKAYKMLDSNLGGDFCSEQSYPIMCGVSRIWVSQNNRRQRIATALMDSLRLNFCVGHVLALHEIALSAPTELGKIFATNYFKTENFFIYM